MAEGVLVFFACLFGVLIRLPFALVEEKSTSDSSGIKSKLQNLRRFGYTHQIHDAVNGEGFFPRPMLFHYLISRLPTKTWRLALVMANASMDVFSAALIALLMAQSAMQAAWIILLAVTMPILFPATARLTAPNNRSFGLFLNVSFFALALYLEPSILTFLLMFLIGYLTILSSTFATQLLLFVGFVFSALAMNLQVCLTLISILTIALATNLLGARDILFFKIAHLKYSNAISKSAFSTRGKALFINLSHYKSRLTITDLITLVLRDSGIIKFGWGMIGLVVILVTSFYQADSSLMTLFSLIEMKLIVSVL